MSSKRKHGSDWVRKRVSQACDQCRKKKLKCDGLCPACSTCVSLEKQCFYGDTVKKRGLPEGYVRALEKLLGLLLLDTVSVGSVTTLFESALKDEAAKADLMRQWNGDGTESGETLPEIWRNSKLCRGLEHLLPSLDAPDNKGQDAKKPRLEPHSIDYGRVVGNPIKPSLQHPLGDAAESLQLPLREVAEDLFNIYFTYTHCWLPIITKDEMLAAYYQALELSKSSLGQGEHAALWAVIAYAECQKSSAPRETNGMAYVKQSPRAESYYEKARRLIPSEGFDPDIGHVQALLVLSLVKLAMGQFRASWLLVSQAINIAIDIGVNNTSSSTFGSSIGRPKHVFLGCFYLDTVIAACLGRRPRFRREDVISVGFLDENGLEEWGYLELGDGQVGERPGPSRSLSIFNHLVRLVCVLNDLAYDQALGELQEKGLESARATFNNWRVSLPSYCSLKDGVDYVSQTAPIPPHQLNLNLTFLICEEIYERKFNVNTERLIEEAKTLRRIVGANSRSAFGSSVFPPAFCLIAGLGLDKFGSSEHQWVTARTASQAGSSGIGHAPTGDQNARDGISNRGATSDREIHLVDIPKSPGVDITPRPREEEHFVASLGGPGFDPNMNSISNHSREDTIMVDNLNWQQASGLHTSEARTSASPGTLSVQNGSPPSMVAVASPSDRMSVQGNIKPNPAWFTKHPGTYSAAYDLFHFAKSRQAGQVFQTGQEGVGVENLQTGFSIPDSVPSRIEGLALDPVLQSMAGVDDHFFELSNLDHFTGDRDETYRHLGFLFPSALQDPFTTPNHAWQTSADLQTDTHSLDEWSQWFGQPAAFGNSQDDA